MLKFTQKKESKGNFGAVENSRENSMLLKKRTSEHKNVVLNNKNMKTLTMLVSKKINGDGVDSMYVASANRPSNDTKND